MSVLTGCAGGNTNNTDSKLNTSTENGKQDTSDHVADASRDVNKTLIMYFSYSGNTKQVAEWIQEYTGADVIQLEAAEPYSDDYDECVRRAEAEHHDQARPELATDVSLIANYDTIILGWPCWNYSCPMLIRTMLEQYDFSGKTIIPFTTSDVSGFSGSLKEMKESSPNAIFEENGLEIREREIDGAQSKVAEWLASLGFKQAVASDAKADEETTEEIKVTEQTESDGESVIIEETKTEEQPVTTEIIEVIEDNKMHVIINGTTFEVELDDGAAAKEFKGMLPLELNLQELNGNEKYGDLPTGLSQNVYSPGTIQAGDILLWGSDTLVVFYESFSTSYSYTRIGRITDSTGLKDAVGKKSVQVRFE